MNNQLNQFNQSLKRNGKTLIMEGKSIKGIVKELNDGVNGIDTKQLCSVESLRQGEILSYNGINYIIVTKNENTNGVYSIYTIRKCPYIIKVDINNVMGIFPMYCNKQSFDLSSPTTGAVGVIPVNTIMVSVQHTPQSEIIAVGQHFYKFNSLWIITGVDKTVEGIITLTCDWKMSDNIPDDEMYWTSDLFGLSLTPTEGNIPLSATLQLVASRTNHGNPIAEDPTNPIKYVSSNPSIATVSTTGLVTSITGGNCIITASINSSISDEEGNWLKITKTTNVKVYAYVLSVTPTIADIDIDSTLQVSTDVSESGVSIVSPLVTYLSSDILVATVNSTGLITGVSTGNSNITVSYTDPYGKVYTKVIAIGVASAHNYMVSAMPTSISIDKNTTSQVIAAVTDKGIAVVSPVVTYSSSDNSVATVDSTGLVTGINGGVANIIVSYIGEDSKTYTVNVPITITIPVPAHIYTMTVDPTFLTGDIGFFSFANASVYDKGVYVSANVIYTSSDSSIATVDEYGQVSGIAEGTCNMICKFTGLDSVVYTKNVPITVTTPVAPTHVYAITVDSNLSVQVGGSIAPNINPTVDNSYMGYQTYTGVSSNETIFTWDGNYINGVAEGVAIFTVSMVAEDGKTYSATCNVTVTPAPHVVVYSAAVSPVTLSLAKASTSQLTATFYADGVATETLFPLTFATSKATVATVSSTGLITCKSLAGTCIITAIYTDQDNYDDNGDFLTYKATCSLTVV